MIAPHHIIANDPVSDHLRRLTAMSFFRNGRSPAKLHSGDEIECARYLAHSYLNLFLSIRTAL